LDIKLRLAAKEVTQRGKKLGVAKKKGGDFALGTYKSWQPESDNITSYGPMLQVTDFCCSSFPSPGNSSVTLSKICETCF